MSFYKDYCKDIEERSMQGLKPKPIDDADLLIEIIRDIKDENSSLRKKSLDFLSTMFYQEQLLRLGKKLIF
jgi:aconitate hydratase 2/2-methylisocitrate dehydratase